MSETRFISDAGGVRQLAQDLGDEPVIALDTEFLTERSYYPRLCLIQIGTPRLLATVDPFACDDLSPLAELLAGPIVLLLHAGAQDLAILRRRLGHLPENVFDTQIAAAFLGFGHSISYARLVESCCAVKLKRSRAFTDWARRPLDDDQLRYALDDVRYLEPIYERLSKEMHKRGRLAWVEEEFRLARELALHDPDPRQQWRRLSGMRATRRRELSVLRELAAWREEEARRRDRPRQHIVPDRVLLEIGRSTPRRVAELEGMRGLHPREHKRSGAAIITAVEAGLAAPEDSMPPARRRSRLDADPDVGVAAVLADTYMKMRARELDLAPQLLANRKDLESIIRLMAENGGAPPAASNHTRGEPAIRLLHGWRREVAGDDVMRLLAGRIALRVKVRKGGVDLVIEDQEVPSPDRDGPPS
ncbi:MAG: ribonuclease D [Acidobacteria bacterium]|nr:ribonuclease D [Acidobacteriota bacterium]